MEIHISLVEDFVIRTVDSGGLTSISSELGDGVGFTLPVSVGNAEVEDFVIKMVDVCVVTTVSPELKDPLDSTLIAVDKIEVCVAAIVDDVISFAFKVVTFSVLVIPLEKVELKSCVELTSLVCVELVDIKESAVDDDVTFDKDIVDVDVVMFT